VRVEVDPEVCEANAVCEDICPEVFHVNDDDVLEILQPEPPADLHDRVRQAVDRCPKAALHLVE
jgi:ferredoxin